MRFSLNIGALSTNQLWAFANKRMYRTAKYNKFKDEVWEQITRQLPPDFVPYTKALDVTLTFSHKTRHKHDIDNSIKSLFDCFNGLVWVDDSQVTILRAEKIYAGIDLITISVAEL